MGKQRIILGVDGSTEKKAIGEVDSVFSGLLDGEFEIEGVKRILGYEVYGSNGKDAQGYIEIDVEIEMHITAGKDLFQNIMDELFDGYKTTIVYMKYK